MKILDAEATAAALGWPVLLAALESTIDDANAGRAACPPRMSVPLGKEAVWLLMPSFSRRADIGACKLITVHADNRQRGLPAIQGDILVIRASTGERLALLDGPTVTARRTAAVTGLAIRLIGAARSRRESATAGAASAAGRAAFEPLPTNTEPSGVAPASRHGTKDIPATCLIIGCGVQGRSHLEALASIFPSLRFFLTSRTRKSAELLAAHANGSGIPAEDVSDAETAEAIAAADLIVCCTDASAVCLHRPPRDGAIIAAIGSFQPTMSELAPAVMREIGRNILLDSADAGHEAGELALARLDPEGLPNLFTWHPQLLPDVGRTVLFKSCGNALWDLAAAQAVVGAP